jgi:hypothetical protein
VQALPGGGQAGVEHASAPPPPPPDDPEPAVAEPVEAAPETGFSGALAPWERTGFAVRRVLEHADIGRWVESEAWASRHLVAALQAPPATPMLRDVRLVAFTTLWDAAIRDLAAALSAQVRPDAAELARRRP